MVLLNATPWPVLASLLVLMAGGLRLRNRSPWTSPVAATGLIVMVGWAVNSHSNPPLAGLSDDTLSCLTWNTDHGQAGWDRLAQTIHGEPTDMVCLVEAGPTEPELDRFWQDRFPNHVSSGLGSGMLVLVRNGTVRQTRSGSLADTVRFRQFDVCCRGHGRRRKTRAKLRQRKMRANLLRRRRRTRANLQLRVRRHVACEMSTSRDFASIIAAARRLVE